MIVWSGATFILRWSCFLGMGKTMRLSCKNSTIRSTFSVLSTLIQEYKFFLGTCMYLHPRPSPPLTSFSNAGISSRFQGSRANFEILTISTAPIWPAMDVLFSFLSSLLSLFTAQRESNKLGTICQNFEQSVFWGYRVSQKFLEYVQGAPRKTIQRLTFWQCHLSSCQ